MILKQLRISRLISQEQLAQMSGLNVRTIQRIESGKKPSMESLKSIAAALDVDVSTLDQENVMIDKQADNWRKLPLSLKAWFLTNFAKTRPVRKVVARIEGSLHIAGFTSCCLALLNPAVLPAGIMMLAGGYSIQLAKYQGDKYDIWYEPQATV